LGCAVLASAPRRFRGAPRRTERQVTSAIDLVVHQARLADGRRAVESVTQVTRGEGEGRANGSTQVREL
jgi:Flp pilus assembly CpaF family ATPase